MENLSKYVEIENEKLKIVDMFNDGNKGFALINESLLNFTHKDIFAWNLIMTLSNINPMILAQDNSLIENYRKIVEKKFNPIDKPNALFLAQVCVNNECDLIWRVHDPNIVDLVLQEEINSKTFEFGYIMTPDEDWSEVAALLMM